MYSHQANQQIKNVSVIYRASGQWSVSGGSGAGVDDYASALAGAILIAQKSRIISQVAYNPTHYECQLSEQQKIADYQYRQACPQEDWYVSTAQEIFDYF